jgi:hypothetical protein
MTIPIGSDYRTRPFSIDLDLHSAIIGQSGVGKSTVMVNSFIRLLQLGAGGVFIDPHGPAVEKILRFIPRARMNDVIYIDLIADGVPGLIPQYKTKKEEQLFKKGVISMLYSLHKNRWGDETERIIKGALDAVTEIYGFINVPAIYLFLARDRFREAILIKCKNPLLADFREQYDEKLRESEQMSRFSPPLNKWDEFVEPFMRTASRTFQPTASFSGMSWETGAISLTPTRSRTILQWRWEDASCPLIPERVPVQEGVSSATVLSEATPATRVGALPHLLGTEYE